jgi:DNA-binding PucR family transcriptional regulator
VTDDESSALGAWVAAFMAETSSEENVRAFVDYVDGAILAETPEVAADPALVAEMRVSTRSQFQVFLSLLERAEQEVLLPPQAIDFALSLARRQLEIGVLLKVYRVGAAAVWDYFARVAAEVPEDGPDRFDVLVYLWEHGGTWLNEAIERLIGVFNDEREASLGGALARKVETVHALIRGDRVPIDAATTDLGYPLRGLQTAIVLWSEEADFGQTDPLNVLSAMATAIASTAAARSLTVPAGRSELWCWLASRSVPDPEEMRDVVLGLDQTHHVRVAVGSTLAGVAGFRASHREAVEAQRLALALPEAAQFTAYHDVELACLVAGNEPGVRLLIERELGGLGDPERGLDRLRETIATYLACGASVEQTAARLIVHKNTIRYRLTQAEELIGHPLTERRTEIALALECFARYAGRPDSGPT